MPAKLLHRSFAGGEITPELFGRVDLTKRQTGLKLAQEAIVLPHGPVVRRPGRRHVNQAKNAGTGADQQVRLMPFSFSANQTMVLEFGHQYVRFHTLGGTLLEAAKNVTGVTYANPAVFDAVGHGYLNGEWVYCTVSADPLVDLLYDRYCIIANKTNDTFELTDLDGNPISTLGMTGYASGELTVARVYTVTTSYSGADVFDLHFAQNADTITIVHPSYAAAELARVSATSWTLTTVTFGTPMTAPAGLTVLATNAAGGKLTDQYYVVTSVDDDGVTESLASAPASDNNDLTLQGNYNTISWSAVAGAYRYRVYKLRGGIYGLVGETDALSVVDDNILPDTLTTPPEDFLELNTGAGDYPAATCYHEQRRWFGGIDDAPQTVFGTRNGTESNLTSSVPSQDDDGLRFRIASNTQNAILHLVPLSDLLALTAGGVWRIFSDGSPAITPTSLSIKPQDYMGANNVQPILASNTMLYVQARGSRIREMAYTADVDYTSVLKSTDVCIMAPHLFNGYTITQIAYSRSPDQILWAVRSDGMLLTLTYVPEQQVYAWARAVETGVESVCVVGEGNEDVVYMVTSRTLRGVATRNIERLNTRIFTDQALAFFVDSGMQLDLGEDGATVARGLWHLEGETVTILADGAVEPEQVVTDGTLTFDESVRYLSVGLPYTTDIETLPIASEGAADGLQGTMKNVVAVHLRVGQTSMFEVGPTFAKLTPNRSRLVSDDYGSPPSLQDIETRIGISGAWTTDGGVCVRQSQPLPLNLLSMTMEVQAGG